MKTKLSRIVLLLIITTLFSCDNKLFNPNQILGEDFTERKINLLLKYDCLDDRYQPLHLDLKYGLGILSKVEVSSGQIKSMNFFIMEAEGKDRYDLLDAKYDKTTIKNGTKIHEFIVTINKGSLENTDVQVSNLATLKMMNKGDLIDIHINSDDSDIQSKSLNIEEYYKTKFGQQFCKSIISNP